MVYDAFSVDLKSKLIFPRCKIDESIYMNYLKESKIFEENYNNFGKFNYLFEHDGATPYMADETMEFIESNAKILYCWPLNSPDLSPIGMIRSIMKNELHNYQPQPTSNNNLEMALYDIWFKISQEKIDNLVITFQYRLEVYIQTFGGCISHLLFNDDNINLYF